MLGSAWVSTFDAHGNLTGDAHCLEPTRVQSIASVGKILLLLETARRIDQGSLDESELLDRRSVSPVGDSGIWQHLSMGQLSVGDAAALVGAVSDNLATNILIQRVGLPAVNELRELLGLQDTALHDLVRDDRSGTVPPTLASGTATELGQLVQAVRTGQAINGATCARVRGWLSINTDLSLVAAAFDLDPLAHVGATPELFNKTGTDAGVRVDVGSVRWRSGGADYAVLASWDDHSESNLAAVTKWMRSVGHWIRQEVTPAD